MAWQVGETRLKEESFLSKAQERDRLMIYRSPGPRALMARFKLYLPGSQSPSPTAPVAGTMQKLTLALVSVLWTGQE